MFKVEKKIILWGLIGSQKVSTFEEGFFVKAFQNILMVVLLKSIFICYYRIITFI